MNERYNGWKNYNTWSVHLWLTNEEASQRCWEQMAREARHAPSCEQVEDGTWSEEGAKFVLADWLKEALEEQAFEAVPGGTLWSDLLGSAMQEVDWDEIAAAFLEGVEA